MRRGPDSLEVRGGSDSLEVREGSDSLEVRGGSDSLEVRRNLTKVIVLLLYMKPLVHEALGLVLLKHNFK